MKVYHISLNEYKDYASSWEFFTDIEDVKKWILKMVNFGPNYDTDDKDAYTLVNEWNELNGSCGKYGLILTEGHVDKKRS